VKNEFSQFSKTQGVDPTEIIKTVDDLIINLNRHSPESQTNIFSEKSAADIAGEM